MPQLENMLSIAWGSKQCRKKTQNYCKIAKRKLPRTGYNFYSGAQFYRTTKEFLFKIASFLANVVWFNAKHFVLILANNQKKDIQIFNHFYSMMIARVDFESLWTKFYDPSALLVFLFMFLPAQLNFTCASLSVSTL